MKLHIDNRRKKKIARIINGFINFFMSLMATITGALMLLEKGIFASFPQEWADKVPFDNWIPVAIIAILLFGVGNAIGFITSFKEKNITLYKMTILMGALLLLFTLVQILLTNEWYMATIEIGFLSVIQILVGSIGLFLNREK